MKNTLVFFLLLCAYHHSNAQSFKSHIYGGAVLSQVDGDRLGGYDKLGFSAGMGVSHSMNRKWNTILELGYIQKGKGIFNYQSNSTFKTILHYLELPILGAYQYSNKLSFQGGISFGFLISHQFLENGEINTTPSYDPHFYDVDYLLAAQYNINEHIGINIRFAYSLWAFGDETPNDTYRPTPWINPGGKYNRSISISAVYNLKN